MQEYERTKQLLRLAIREAILAEVETMQQQIAGFHQKINEISSGFAKRIAELQLEGQEKLSQLHEITQQDFATNKYGPGRQTKIIKWLLATAKDPALKEKFHRLTERHTNADSLLRRGKTFADEGNFQEALTAFSESVAAWRNLDFKSELLQALKLLGGAQNSTAQYASAVETYQECIGLAKQLNQRRCLADCLYELALVLNSPASLSTIQESVGLYRDLQLPAKLAMALHQLGHCYKKQGDESQALACYQESLTLSRNQKLELDTARTLSSLGLLHLDKGKADLAVTAFTECVSIRRLHKHQEALAKALNNLGLALVQLDRTEEAIQAYTESVVLQRELNCEPSLVKALSALAGLLNYLGRRAEAVPFMNELKRLKDKSLS